MAAPMCISLACNKQLSRVILSCTRQYCRTPRTVALPTNVKVDDNVMERIRDDQHPMTFKTHSGRHSKMKCVPLPAYLRESSLKTFKQYKNSSLYRSRHSFENFLKKRQPKIEDDLYAQRLQKEQEKIMINSRKPLKDNQALHFARKKVNQTVYYWKPLNWEDKDLCYQYLISRMAQNYTVIFSCLQEIKNRDPYFVPSTVYDFASGLCSTAWAVLELWPGKKIEHIHCFDPSECMNELAQLILQGGHKDQSMISNVIFQSTRPPALIEQSVFPLVVSAHALMELPSREERLLTVARLWAHTENYLVLIENGSLAGHQLIQEAREFILMMSRKDSEDEDDWANVFSPCPHNNACPLQQIQQKKRPCTFMVKSEPLKPELIRDNPRNNEELYSYVVLHKGPLNVSNSWPRVIEDLGLKKRSKYQEHMICCPDGTVRRYKVSKSKNDRDMLKMFYYSHWGCRLPIDLSNTTPDLSDPGNLPASDWHEDEQFNDSDFTNSDNSLDTSIDLDHKHLSDTEFKLGEDLDKTILETVKMFESQRSKALSDFESALYPSEDESSRYDGHIGSTSAHDTDSDSDHDGHLDHHVNLKYDQTRSVSGQHTLRDSESWHQRGDGRDHSSSLRKGFFSHGASKSHDQHGRGDGNDSDGK